ncbi:MAG: PLP-dependent transferase [Opitutaceae bacterium]
MSSVFPPLPLGQRIPDRPHAVSCSLPTMRDVRGYEEKDPATLSQLTSGYPRFVVHPWLRLLAAHLGMVDPAIGPDRTLWLVSSARMARDLAAHLGAGADARPCAADGIHGVHHRPDPEVAREAKLYLQHVGGFLSSRAAEERLVRLGHLPAVEAEDLFPGDAPAEVRRHLRAALPGAADADLFPAACGMNAVWAAFRAVSDLQAARGRTAWLQLGWLYLDTIALLRKFTGGPADYLPVRDVLDHRGLERLFATHGSRLAGVMVEVPTNPLIQTPDLPALADLCRRHGVRLVADPSLASVFSLDVLPHADLVVTSLTKYAAGEGDLVAGLVAVNPAGPDAAELRPRVAAALEPVHPRDLARLATQIGQAPDLVRRIEGNTAAVVAFLRGHPAVRDVYWALQEGSAENYRRLARQPNATGGMITFTLRRPGALEACYDALRLPKGPSFGMHTTLICPFLYLAHYDLVTTPAGRAELAAHGLEPDLLRLCCGTEPAAEIIGALREALDRVA